MLIASPDPIWPTHVSESAWAVNDHKGSFEPHPKVWGRQLEDLNCFDDAVNPTALFFAYTKAAHEVGQTFIAGLVTVNESFHRHNRLAGNSKKSNNSGSNLQKRL